MSKNVRWPENCAWPEPIGDGAGSYWDEDLAMMEELDEKGEDLKSIKEYFDELVEKGRLNEDYSFNFFYDDFDDEAPDDLEEEWLPEFGDEYWIDDRFDVEAWEEDLTDHINRLKLDTVDSVEDPIIKVREILGYSFINENLLRQAFTRRSFAAEYGLSGCCEELEFYGDQILGMVVSKEMKERFSSVRVENTDAPFYSSLNEGELSKLRSHFVSREYLSARAENLGLNRFILYGKNEKPSDSAREDMIEALIGAAAVDCGWKWDLLDDIVDKLICIQLDKTDEFLKETFYEQLNRWHQKHFHKMPEYEVERRIRHSNARMYGAGGVRDTFYCTLRFLVPENDKGIPQYQRIDTEDDSRSSVREYAALQAVSFIVSNGLWMNLKNSGIVPDKENSINQLQELFQKKYIEQPEYRFNQFGLKEWMCICSCGVYTGVGEGVGKTRAKKEAAYQVLEKMIINDPIVYK